MNIITIQTAIAEALAEVDGIAQAAPNLPDDIGQLPFAGVGLPVEIEFFASMGRDTATVEIKVLVARTDTENAVETLAGLLARGETGNVIDALSSLRKQPWGALRVIKAGEIGEYTVAGTSYLGVTITAEVLA